MCLAFYVCYSSALPFFGAALPKVFLACAQLPAEPQVRGHLKFLCITQWLIPLFQFPTNVFCHRLLLFLWRGRHPAVRFIARFRCSLLRGCRICMIWPHRGHGHAPVYHAGALVTVATAGQFIPRPYTTVEIKGATHLRILPLYNVVWC
ncbi:hypothetical protein C8Q78DRAFT_1005574 [Trametes maxima]|nr:hypothetical protein C8Q78DRAFT_1005574 [Trametes maxima]